MARRSQCSSAGDNPLDPNYLPPHYREEYRLAIDALIEEDLDGYYQFLQKTDVVDFLSPPEIQYIQECVQIPQHSNLPEQRFLETSGDGSSDTYWPLHSDLDAPGLDLGWPQLHHFIGPTEVTTLVNPAEPDMPSIKEQARRLIKNAQQVIAIAMDIFTDVDIFHDVVTAAMRNVAVYILLDEQNAHLFLNMVSNCRVNLQSIQFLRVRTVSGISYHCRSGKSFKGQMMDRFLLTDCRAVLSGNYSFMWSFEKLHRCMAHLFLGQLVSTFDEEFRILYAQSQPLVVENTLAPMEDFSLLQKRQFPSDLTSLYREPRRFQQGDMVQSEEWARHSHDERMDVDWRMMPFKRRDSLHGPADMYGRFPPQQSRMDPSFDQGASRMAMMENPAFKRHSYAEGVHGRYSFPFVPQQGTPEPENQGRQFQRRQQPYPGPGKEAESTAYDKFWNQDYLVADQYSEPGLPQEIEPSDNFDPVLNYLSSTRNVDFDQSSDKLPQAADLPLSSSFPRRTSLGQIYACQTSPTPPNSAEQKQFFPEPKTDRKDPIVKRGLRDWRISSYLSAYDSKGDDGLPLAPPNAPDLGEEPTNLLQQTTLGKDFSIPKIPNVREFKVPAVPRASQIPGYAKIATREQPKKLPDEGTAVATTPTPSDSSSTTEGEKTEEAEQKEPKIAGLHREESFRRKYNPTVPRSSRLRSSLIFSSLEHQHTQDTKTPQGQQDEGSDKNEVEQTKQPFVLGQRRSAAKEPFEWSRYIKSATFDSSTTDSSKPDEETSKVDVEDSSKDKNTNNPSGKVDVQESLQPPDVDQANTSPSMPQSKPSEAELPKTHQADQPVQLPKSLLTSPLCVDMSDPDTRLMFFKELAAKRKAAKATEAEKSKEKVLKPSNAPSKMTTGEKKEVVLPTSEGLSEKNVTAKDEGKDVSVSLSVEATDKTNKDGSQVKDDPNTTQSCKQTQTRLSTDSDMLELQNVQLEATLSVSVEAKAPQSEPPQEPKISSPAVGKSSTSQPPTPTNATPAAVASLAQGTDENKNLHSTSTESSSLFPISVDVTPSSACAALDSSSQSAESAQLEISVSSSPLLSEQPTRSKCSYSIPSDHIVADSGSQVRPSTSSSTSLSTLEGSSSTMISSTLPTNAQLTSESVEKTSQKPTSSSISQIDSESTQDHLDSTHTSAAGSLQSSTKNNSEGFCASTPSEKDIPQSENDSVLQIVEEESEVFGTSSDVKGDSLNPSSTESCVPNVADLESKSTSDQNEIIIPTASPAGPTSEHSPAERNSPVHTDSTVNPSQSETASSQGAPIQGSPPSELDPIRPVTPSPAETVSCSSPRAESVETVLPPEAEKTFPALQSSSSTSSLSEQITTVSNETPLLPPTETCSPTSNVPAEPDLPCKTSEPVISETHPSEPPVPTGSSTMVSLIEVTQGPEMPDAGEEKGDVTEATNKINNTTTTQESVGCEKTDDQVRKNSCSELPETTSDEVVPSSPQSKQPKTSQSRYHSSTANVLSSSNLRDDTKLLLEQISANSQSRNEATKESPVTDDEKEDEADKNALRQKERGIRSFSRGQPKSEQDREKLLERIQSMRKERKVYSRFEMAP